MLLALVAGLAAGQPILRLAKSYAGLGVPAGKSAAVPVRRGHVLVKEPRNGATTGTVASVSPVRPGERQTPAATEATPKANATAATAETTLPASVVAAARVAAEAGPMGLWLGSRAESTAPSVARATPTAAPTPTPVTLESLEQAIHQARVKTGRNRTAPPGSTPESR